MANINIYFPKLLKYEGGYVNDPVDRGGATNKGVTLATWKSLGYDKDDDGDIDANDIKLLTDEDAKLICKKNYWDRWKADEIKNQSVAETLVEWVWGSGKWGIIIPQRILQVLPDGSVGHKTIEAVNGANQLWLHEKIRMAKLDFIHNIVKTDPKQERFLKGWLRRINEFKYKDNEI